MAGSVSMLHHFFSVKPQTDILATETSDFLKQIFLLLLLFILFYYFII